jgi:hypothetical protein
MFRELNSREFAALYRQSVIWWRKSFEAFVLQPSHGSISLTREMGGLLQELEDERMYRRSR